MMKKIFDPFIQLTGKFIFLFRLKVVLNSIAFLMLTFLLNGQESESVFSHADFMENVLQNHPLTYKSNLLTEMAAANSLSAKGEFDPKVETYYDQKAYDDKNYYSVFSSELKIPTWFGVDLNAGYEFTNGEFLDNSAILPPRGIWNAGISANLGNGLLFDERRAAIRKAEVFEKSSEAERILMLNELIFEANWAYWDWSARHAILNIAKLGLEIAEERLDATIIRYENGDIPAVDTLESLIVVQNRLIDTLNAQQELIAAKFYLQNFLWKDGYLPLEFQTGIIPEQLNYHSFMTRIDSLQLVKNEVLQNHPELLIYEYEIDNLEIEEKLNKEALKPKVQIAFNPLVGSTNEQLFRSYDVNDYKMGASFAYPLFLRKERGDIKMTRIKIRDTFYDKERKKQDIFLKLDIYRSNSKLIESQTLQLEKAVANYDRLLEAENQKFNIGESSVFLINSREVQFLESQVKLTELKLKLMKNTLAYLLTSGQLYNL